MHNIWLVSSLRETTKNADIIIHFLFQLKRNCESVSTLFFFTSNFSAASLVSRKILMAGQSFVFYNISVLYSLAGDNWTLDTALYS